MLNNRNDHDDESEYHFSDDDVSYEVEPETVKPAVTNTKEKWLARFKSRRIVISVVVFLILIFVVYKMIAPSTPPATDISAVSRPVTVAAAPVQQTPATLPQQAVVQNPVVATPPPAYPQQVQSPVVTQAAMQAPVTMPTSTPTNNVAMTNQVMQAQIPTAPAQPMQPVQPNQAQAYPTTAPQTMQPPANVPPGMPAQAPQVTPPVNQASSPGSALAQASQTMAAQVDAQYAQKLNDYETQNKALENQVQVLNNRVASMEAQLNQLVQALTRQTQASTAENAPAAVVDTHAAYNVQAIIPGRAWLRSDNGETVTVAEGDMVRGLGRVTKIDPYDGVVEINTGNKIISLSYGNGS
jgi:hypothetical protein